MTIFDYLDYKKFLKGYIENQPKKGWGIVSKIADGIDMSQAHVSQVVSGAKDFTTEQALKLTEFLQFTNLETDYFMLLVQRDRAGTQGLKKYYLEKIEKLKVEALKIKNHVEDYRVLTDSEIAIFYSSWIYSAIRMYCSIGKGQMFEDIAHHFHLKTQDLKKIMEFLTNHDLCRRQGLFYQMGIQRTLIEKGSAHYVKHSANWRFQAIQRSERMSDKEIFITSPMSLSKADLETVRNEILALVKKISGVVKDSPAEEVACLNIDLFSV